MLIASYSVRWPSWLDDSHLVGIDPSGSQTRALIADIQSGETKSVALPHSAEHAIANGHGAVAFSWARDDDWPDTHYSFVVWQDGEFTDARDGFAEAWALDGSALAVLHQFGRVRAPSGWVSVLSWPTLKSLFADAPPYATGLLLFDPTGKYVAYRTDLGLPPEDDEFLVRVVDLQTGAPIDLPRDNRGGFYWTAQGEIAVIRADRSMKTYSTSGEVLDRAIAPYPEVNTSADGSTAAYWDGDSETDTIHIVREGQDRAIHAPHEVGRVSLSPDGTLLVVGVSGAETYLRAL